MSLDELIKYNKLVYGVEPKITTTAIKYVGGNYCFELKNLSRNHFIFIPVENVKLSIQYSINGISKNMSYFGNIIKINDILQLSNNYPFIDYFRIRVSTSFLEGVVTTQLKVDDTLLTDTNQVNYNMSVALRNIDNFVFSNRETYSGIYILEYDPSIQIW